MHKISVWNSGIAGRVDHMDALQPGLCGPVQHFDQPVRRPSVPPPFLLPQTTPSTPLLQLPLINNPLHSPIAPTYCARPFPFPTACRARQLWIAALPQLLPFLAPCAIRNPLRFPCPVHSAPSLHTHHQPFFHHHLAATTHFPVAPSHLLVHLCHQVHCQLRLRPSACANPTRSLVCQH